ncbi:hypothetical protein [Falsiroseomonas sp. HW251]|uniref:hypothetical protein n=1 Tax=Falsiroseomonas sp. HW251 TaxID=3390998 RepID=UPI003D3128B7
MRATGLILLALLLANPALAQPAARLAAAFGGVTLLAPAEGRFAPAASGSALVPGSTLRTGAGARAVLVLGGALLALEEESEVAILPPDGPPGGPPLALARGTMAALLRGAGPLAAATPRGIAEFDGPGRFLLEAGDAGQPTRLVVVAGKARLATEAGTLPLEPGQAGFVPPQGLARMAPAEGVPALLAWVAGETPRQATAPPQTAIPLPAPAPVPPPAPPTVVVIEETVPYSYAYPVLGGWAGRPVRPHLPPVPPARPAPPPAHPSQGPHFPPALMTVLPSRGGGGGITGR